MEKSEPIRRDAKARREALLDAAAECFMEEGYQVPLERIAERAGVGRGTLYRNFQDRADLALAIFGREVDAGFFPFDPDASLEEVIERFVRAGQRATALYFRLAADLPLRGDRRAAFEALGRRAEAILAPYLERWHASGHLDRTIGSTELLLTVRMLSSLFLTPLDEEESDIRLPMVIKLVLNGLAPRR